jgi:hypothetical protein
LLLLLLLLLLLRLLLLRHDGCHLLHLGHLLDHLVVRYSGCRQLLLLRHLLADAGHRAVHTRAHPPASWRRFSAVERHLLRHLLRLRAPVHRAASHRIGAPPCTVHAPTAHLG